ncbi:MAG: T4 family baseplate hub assembly chaperone [Nitrososphaeraceae archaeon]
MEEVQNPLLLRIKLPGETFRLPSQGLFYTNGELDSFVKNGEVEIYPMTAIDEIIISTPDKLLSGKAIEEVLSHCVPEITNARQMLAKDVDFLMVCLRRVSFGQFMEVNYTHNCEHATEHVYSVDLQQMIRNTKAIDPTTLKDEYVCELDNGQVVRLKPMTYGDIIDLYQDTMILKVDVTDEKSAEKLIINTMASVIKDVDGITDQEQIKEWLGKIKLGWKSKIQEAIQSATEWGIDMKSIQKCPDCGEVVELKISANPVNFFI